MGGRPLRYTGLAFLCAGLALSAMVPISRAEGPSPPPVGSSICLGFAHILEYARFKSRDNENFRIEDPEKTLRYIEYATPRLTLLKPVGGWTQIPYDVKEVRAAIATLGFDFNPREWSTEPGEAMVVYYEDFNLDYDPDLAFERGHRNAPCSRFEFWQGDPITGVLRTMAVPEGWQACGAAWPGREQGRFLIAVDGVIALPVFVKGKGLEADFFIYKLKQPAPSDAETPQQRAAKSSSKSAGVPPLCRVHLERKVDVITKGPELCGRFSEQVHDVLHDRSYAIGELADRLLTLLKSRGAALELSWRDIPVAQTAEETKAALQERGLTGAQADRLLAAFPGASRLWLAPQPNEGQPTVALAQGRGASGRMRTVLIQIAGDAVTALEVPRALSPSNDSEVSYFPASYEGRRMLLEIYKSSPASLDIGVTSLEPVERLCELDVRDRDMVAAIEYDPTLRP
jgi:hypothetical protein